MVGLSIKNRIAFYYILGTAILILMLFVAIREIVSVTIHSQIDDNIETEVQKHIREIKVVDAQIELLYEDEWMEREHNTIEVNPVFVEFVSHTGTLFEKSPNLKDKELLFNPDIEDFVLFDTSFQDKLIRQIQVPIFDAQQNKIGYLLIAMSREHAVAVVQKLDQILWLTFPLTLFLLFFLARVIAGKSVAPVQQIITTTKQITEDNLSYRIDLPNNKDELYQLAITINSLLDRIEKMVEREKEFTSHASHELRTPLAILKGTLEVLNRKERTTEEYQEKIAYCISEINRMNALVDDLLLLARIESYHEELSWSYVSVADMLEILLDGFSARIQEKQLRIVLEVDPDFQVYADEHLLQIVLGNLVSNAIKYNVQGGTIALVSHASAAGFALQITDTGIGFDSNSMLIFQQFYRSPEALESKVNGTGLGLAIVKKLTHVLHFEVQFESEINVGTTATLLFKPFP